MTGFERDLKVDRCDCKVPLLKAGSVLCQACLGNLPPEVRHCATCGKPGHKPMDHAGWHPDDEGRG